MFFNSVSKMEVILLSHCNYMFSWKTNCAEKKFEKRAARIWALYILNEYKRFLTKWIYYVKLLSVIYRCNSFLSAASIRKALAIYHMFWKKRIRMCRPIFLRCHFYLRMKSGYHTVTCFSVELLSCHFYNFQRCKVWLSYQEQVAKWTNLSLISPSISWRS